MNQVTKRKNNTIGYIAKFFFAGLIELVIKEADAKQLNNITLPLMLHIKAIAAIIILTIPGNLTSKILFNTAPTVIGNRQYPISEMHCKYDL